MSINKLFPRRTLRQIFITTRSYYTVQSSKVAKPHNEFTKQLYSRIKVGGPITVADYMKEVLTSPAGGYYMYNDVFGQGGDFITSPELGQIFGEMIAIWFLNEWSKAGSPKPIQIVELGPGRGTLCQDILRVFGHFRLLEDSTVHLVEISPYLSDLQARRLCLPSEINIETTEHAEQKENKNKDSLSYREGKSTSGVPIAWYKHLDDVPNAFTLLVAHEFFDALPIHKFQKTDQGYREVLVDIDPATELNFRFVLSTAETPVGKLFIKSDETRPHLEVSPESLSLAQKISAKLERYGGLALIADYGHEGEGTDTFRAFKKHEQHDPLVEPGSADLTADVDFTALKKAATENHEILAFGPINQRDFLLNMGIEHRLKKLKENAREDQMKSLEYSYQMMTDPDKMGTRFKFLALLPASLEKILKKFPATGFQ